MLEDFKDRYTDVRYIITKRINQDILENLFSSLRGMIASGYCIRIGYWIYINIYMQYQDIALSPLEFKYWLV